MCVCVLVPGKGRLFKNWKDKATENDIIKNRAEKIIFIVSVDLCVCVSAGRSVCLAELLKGEKRSISSTLTA